MYRSLLLASCVLGSAAVANANYIVNGSFENPFQHQNGSWGLYTSIPGWNSAVNGAPIEIGTGGTYGVTGFHLAQVMELDSTGNATVTQVNGVTGPLTLSFLYAMRAGGSGTNDAFSVYWNGGLLQSFTPNSTAMTLFSATVSGNGNNTLAFWGTGTSNSYGGIIDDVRLVGVPDGAATLVLLSLSMFGLGFFRRKLV